MVITVCTDELVLFRFHKVVAADYAFEFSDFYAEATVGACKSWFRGLEIPENF